VPPITTAQGRGAQGRPLKSPLAVPAGHAGPRYIAPDESPAPRGVPLTDREATLAEFEDYLRTTNNRDGRPYEDRTIEAYLGPAKNLDKWLTANKVDGDFTVADTALLNKYFREYYRRHRQGGTHTLQRNLIQLFNFLARERSHPSPYTDRLNWYAEVKGHPKTLGAQFVEDLLEVTGSGRARDFEMTVRELMSFSSSGLENDRRDRAGAILAADLGRSRRGRGRLRPGSNSSSNISSCPCADPGSARRARTRRLLITSADSS
jgi:hypothetical protein